MALVVPDSNYNLSIQGNSVGQFLQGQLAEFPTILDSLLSGIVNTTSIPVGIVGSRVLCQKHFKRSKGIS